MKFGSCRSYTGMFRTSLSPQKLPTYCIVLISPRRPFAAADRKWFGGRSKRPDADAASSFSIHSVAHREEIGSAIDAAKAVGAEGLNVLASALVFNSRAFIFDRARALRLPPVYQWPQMAEEGGLIGYGPLIVPLWRDAMSRQLAKLLRAAKPRHLPVEEPTRFELVLNLKTAKAIGHDVPSTLVVRADKVIE